MDEVRIWRVARTQMELRATMCGSIDEPTIFATPELMHYWMFDEHEGAVIANAVPSGAPGVMQGDVARKPGLGDPLAPYDGLPFIGNPPHSRCDAGAGAGAGTGGPRPPPPPPPAPAPAPAPGGAPGGCCTAVSVIDGSLTAVPDRSITPQVVSVSTAGWDRQGYETFRLQLALSGNRESVYAIYGKGPPSSTETMLMQLPAAFQVDTPFGADLGGVNPAFFAFSPDALYDSWLTIGKEDGDIDGSLSSIEVPFADWSPANPMTVDNGAAFYMDPDAAAGTESNAAVLLAQLTVPAGGQRTATMGAQGRCSGGAADWDAYFSFEF
jgi:hypothetical protein